MQNFLKLTGIIDKDYIFFQIFTEKKLTDVVYFVFCYVSQILRKIFCKFKKLSYINKLMYNLVMWFDWSMALKFNYKIPSTNTKNTTFTAFLKLMKVPFELQYGQKYII